ncbi:MAG: carbon-nitrogen hydrolase family protein [Gemmatimonadales bacterium]
MRVTVCELPHAPAALAAPWAELCHHTSQQASELVLLPEFAFVDPVWEAERFDPVCWAATEALSDAWLQRLPELGARYVVGARPASIEGRRFNQGYLWSADGGLAPLRSKCFLPAEPGGWEARWFDRGDPAFPAFHAGALSFGLNICTELWALETYAAYAALNVQVILSPRATAAATTAKWLSVGVVAAVRSGAFSLSSNRVDSTGAYGGAGWIISPDGRILANTTPDAPFATFDIDLADSAAARDGYPRYVFSGDSV